MRNVGTREMGKYIFFPFLFQFQSNNIAISANVTQLLNLSHPV